MLILGILACMTPHQKGKNLNFRVNYVRLHKIKRTSIAVIERVYSCDILAGLEGDAEHQRIAPSNLIGTDQD